MTKGLHATQLKSYMEGTNKQTAGSVQGWLQVLIVTITHSKVFASKATVAGEGAKIGFLTGRNFSPGSLLPLAAIWGLSA